MTLETPVSAPSAQPAARWKVRWRYASPILVIHLLALLAFFPWFFSWTGVVLAVLGLYVFGTLGINIGYHRLLTHRGFSCPRWLERTLAVLGACSAQDSPIVWAAIHRRHHQFADEETDPHSPLVSFLWGHIGWLVVKRPDMDFGALAERYAKDLTRDPFHRWLDKSDNWVKLALVAFLLYFAVGFIVAALTGSTLLESFQFGMSLMVWGGFVRLVLTWHITWSVNSITHLWGYRNYNTPDSSRNNVVIGLVSMGEGWHNNHHADPRSARHGHKWWEFDASWLTIRLWMALGLAKNVTRPSPILAAKFNAPGARPDPAGFSADGDTPSSGYR